MSDASQTFLSELASQLLDQLIRIGRSEERHLGSPVSNNFKHTERCLGEHNKMRDLFLLGRFKNDLWVTQKVTPKVNCTMRIVCLDSTFLFVYTTTTTLSPRGSTKRSTRHVIMASYEVAFHALYLLNDRMTASHTVKAAAFVGKARRATGTTP